MFMLRQSYLRRPVMHCTNKGACLGYFKTTVANKSVGGDYSTFMTLPLRKRDTRLVEDIVVSIFQKANRPS